MSKEDILSLVVYLIMMAIALTVGFVILQPIISGGKLGDNGSVFCFLILSVIIGLIVNALIVEIGHIIGAIIGKYEILSINILSFAFFKKKEEGKIVNSFKFPKNYDGLTGETVISPKSEKSKPMSYVFGPLVLFLIELLGCICAFMYIKDSNGESILNFVKYGIFLSTCIGGMIIVYDYFPSRLDNLNDGYQGNISILQLTTSSGISRSVFKNLLQKMKDNLVAEIENQGTKGTYIKIIDGTILQLK